MEGGRRTEKNNYKEKKKFGSFPKIIVCSFPKIIFFYPFAKPVDQWPVLVVTQ